MGNKQTKAKKPTQSSNGLVIITYILPSHNLKLTKIWNHTFVFIDLSDVLTTYQQLITMGFDEKLSMTAAKKYGKNIDSAIAYISSQEPQTKPISANNNPSITIPHQNDEKKSKPSNDPSKIDATTNGMSECMIS